MFSIIDLQALLETEFPTRTFFPLEYPIASPIESCVVDMFSTTPSSAGVFNANVQVTVRADHPSKAEQFSHELRSFLNKKSNFMLKDVQVVTVRSQNPVPLFTGKDTNGNYLYSNNFILLCNEGVNL